MDLEKFLVKADQALRKRNTTQAIALYKQVLMASPDHGPARAGLLAAFRRKAELKGGPSLLDRTAAKSLRAAAAGLAGAKQAAALVKTCETGLEKDPQDAYLAARLAGALETLDRPQEALSTWQHRLSLDERDAEALKSAGKLHYRLREIAEAIDCLDRAHAVDATDPEVEKLRKNLAAEGTLAATKFETAQSSRELAKDQHAMRAAERTGRKHRSEDELAEDIAGMVAEYEAAPGDLDLCRRLARAQMKAEDYDAAEATAAAGLQQFRDEDSLLDLCGDARLKRARLAVAEAQASGDKPALKAGKAALAAAEVEEIGRRVRRNPGDSALRLRLARACYRAGETEGAIEQFQAVVSDPRVEVEARQGLGACFFRKGLMPLARRQFEQALESVGGVGGGDRGKEICYSLGLVCERLGESQDALARFMEIYEVDLNYKDVGHKIEELSG